VKKQKEIKNGITKAIENEFSGDLKIVTCDSITEAKSICRWISEHRIKNLAWREMRPYMLIDKWEFKPMNEANGTLKVYGHLRGNQLSANQLIHIPKFGSFQIGKITSIHDGFQRDFKDIVAIPDENQESLISEITPDLLENEQTWPTDDELMPPPNFSKNKGTQEQDDENLIDEEEGEEGDDDDLFDGLEDEDDEMFEDDGEDDDEEEEEIIEIKSQSDNQSQVDTKFDLNKDEDMDEQIREEERQTYLKTKSASQEYEKFPDEFELTPNQPGRVRLQKYRGLKSYRSSPWDPKENLPLDYAKIYQFKDFKLTQRRVLKKHTGVEVDGYYCVEILNVPKHIEEIYVKELMTVFGLLKHEQKKSMMHFQIRKAPGCDDPLKSKDELYAHVGFRTFKCNPIFSEYNPKFKKHKFERYLQNGVFYAASFFAPITFTPCPIVFFKKDSITNQFKLVASGTTLGADPDRIILKKIVLSGHPFKIHARQAVVRFMFYSPEDIKWFKPVDLWTKHGRNGVIKESLGTHGYMKCLFDDILQGNDTVCMSLYKRVFPKWTTEETSL
jgi:pre-rRNA-processing protein TSR1